MSNSTTGHDIIARAEPWTPDRYEAEIAALRERVQKLAEALQGLYEIVTDDDARGVDDTIDKRSAIAVAFTLLKEIRE